MAAPLFIEMIVSPGAPRVACGTFDVRIRLLPFTAPEAAHHAVPSMPSSRLSRLGNLLVCAWMDASRRGLLGDSDRRVGHGQLLNFEPPLVG
jgi:hypothetical protein